MPLNASPLLGQINDSDLDFARQMLMARSGLALSKEKRYLLESRLTPICRQLNLTSFNALFSALRKGAASQLESLVVEAMTTNETLFFRDRGPFDVFKQTLLPHLLKAKAGKGRLRIWCAAASSGQEPYSLAMILDEMASQLAGWRIDILATDLSEEIIQRAKKGLYSQFEVQRGLPIQMLLKHFTQVGEQWQISSKIKSMVEFRTLNLIRDFSALGEFDIIFCRNVLIYFDPKLKSDVLNRLAKSLCPVEGALFLGASETVLGLETSLSPHQSIRGLYSRRIAASPVQAALPYRRFTA
jgi:chemotaxis protein methyltransferase CheR